MSKRALLVEDDGAIATVIRTALSDEGLAVEVCDTIAGRDKLLAAAAFDVMLTDVMLLDGDGIELRMDQHRATAFLHARHARQGALSMPASPPRSIHCRPAALQFQPRPP